MKTALVERPIELASVLAEVTAPECGAVVLFLGTVRDRHGGRAVAQIAYSAYRPMAETALARIASELEATIPDSRVAIVHRLGDSFLRGSNGFKMKNNLLRYQASCSRYFPHPLSIKT